MPIISHVKLMVVFPSEPVQRVIETWARSIKAEAPTVYEKIQSRIPTAEKFQERIAQPSSLGFQPFVSEDFKSKSGLSAKRIRTGQVSNLKLPGAYEKYSKRITKAFETVEGEEAKRFREMAEQMKTVYASGVAYRTLPFTGSKIEGKGPGPLAASWLVKEMKVVEQLRAGDQVLQGGPFRICRIEDVPLFKAGLVGRLTQAGAEIVKSNFAEDIIKEENDRTNGDVQRLIDPALGLKPFATGTESHLDYVLDETQQLWLDVQVATV